MKGKGREGKGSERMKGKGREGKGWKGREREEMKEKGKG